MLYPALHELKSNVDSKYMIVTMAAKRARELQDHPDYAVFGPYKSVKNVGRALEEIAKHKVIKTN
ncbi:DNA-directed RNA polymerase subunit omega [Phocicoccus schoeneichii]|uniref:DNA-directed RNA polymerase subunit omega n=1 Tax=Phocicoccus schoeneichii TaxID=1812261 RepID=A0A6V7RFK9_9BACL|nr:DNA-directed RNA polymerase subunit omega [Jeotgalicoccus schoeneichii]GGH49602.1 DNA-directed RNA polymerase subunit omega [Jeotgalicoccus schoeneichii]CAD2075999.1 DNA-directed RNA polymerase subunit omega [Jeotgalicoccus schoeneichii]